MILIMAYAVLLAACLAAAAAALEPVCRALRAPARWVWVWGLVLALVSTMGVMVLPSGRVHEIPMPAALPVTPLILEAPAPAAARFADPLWEQAGFAAIVLWVGASVLMLAGLAAGAWRLSRERRQAGRSHVHGHFVLLTDGVGPAVAGVRDPVALIPRWVLELDESSQRLLLAHEMEHVRARDSTLLVLGSVLAALLPWNPLVWWMLRRLRLAVEVDCDHRVLAREGGIRRYAELLLMTARIPSEHARALVAGLGERESDLERRIVAMTESAGASMRPILSRAVAPALLASALIFAACETPRPDPIGPSTLGMAAEATVAERPAGENWIQHEGPVRLDGSLRDSLIHEDEVRARQPHYHFQSGESRLVRSDSSLRFNDEEVKASAVRRRLPLKEQELRVPPPQLPSRIRSEPEMLELKKKAAANLRGPETGPRIVLRDPNRVVEPIEVRVLSHDGRELAAELRGSQVTESPLLSRIDPQQIESIEVVKGRAACPARNTAAQDACAQVVITLKPGYTLRAR